MREHAAKWLLYARQQTRAEADAQDVVHEALADAWLDPGPDHAAHRQLQQALGKLNPAFREVVTLKFWGELSFTEIGAALDIPADAGAGAPPVPPAPPASPAMPAPPTPPALPVPPAPPASPAPPAA